MTRRMHFCGSLPPELATSNRAAMEWFVEHSNGHQLTAIPTKQDPNWIVEWLRGLADNTDVFEITRPGDYADYDDMRTHRVRRGVTLRPEHISHGDVDRTIAQLHEFQAYRDRTPSLEGAKLLLPVPAPIDLAVFTFVGTAQQKIPSLAETARALRHLPVLTQATVDYVSDVSKDHGGDVVWHLETPGALVGMYKASVVPGGAMLAAGYLSRQLADLLARLPKQADVILHLCYGDYKHKPVFVPRSLDWAVAYLNRLAAQLRDRDLAFPPVHIPVAYGAEPPSQDPAYYQALGRLDQEWQVIPGVISASDEQRSICGLELFEIAAGREGIAVACACGLGRMGVAAAIKSADVMAAAANAADAASQTEGSSK